MSEQQKERTREHIKQTFLKLMSVMAFNRITVSKIAQEAKINRGTFYLHFEDKYAVLEEIEETFLDELEVRLYNNIGNHLHKNVSNEKGELIVQSENVVFEKKNILALLNFIVSYSDILKIVISENGDPSLINRAKELYFKVATDKINGQNNPRIEFQEFYEMKFIIAGAFEIVYFWIMEDSRQTIEEISETLFRCFLTSPIHYSIFDNFRNRNE